jgi:hypothetical protein
MEPQSSSLPMFDVERVQLAFSVAADFVAAQVANNVLVLALSTNRILRIDLDSPEDVEGRLSSLPRSKCQPQQVDLTMLMNNRHRPPQEILGSWSDSAHVPRPIGISFDYHHDPRRKLLSPCPDTVATTEIIDTIERRVDRKRCLESLFTHCLHSRNPPWCH